MIIKQIKLGTWVETKFGIGTVERVGGTPPSVQVHVRTPIPRGLISMTSREVLRQLSHEESKLLNNQFAEEDSSLVKEGA